MLPSWGAILLPLPVGREWRIRPLPTGESCCRGSERGLVPGNAPDNQPWGCGEVPLTGLATHNGRSPSLWGVGLHGYTNLVTRGTDPEGAAKISAARGAGGVPEVMQVQFPGRPY